MSTILPPSHRDAPSASPTVADVLGSELADRLFKLAGAYGDARDRGAYLQAHYAWVELCRFVYGATR